MDKNYCKKCGNKISGKGKTGLCKSCVGRRRKGIKMKKGWKPNKEWREQHRKAKLGCILSDETKEKIRKKAIKRWKNKEEREKQSKIRKLFFQKNEHPRGMLGKKHTEKTKNRMSENQPKKEKHYNWQGGKSFEPYSLEWTEKLRKKIRKRDNYICQLCNQKGNAVHHIDYNKKNCRENNLITLCIKCNTFVNYNRENWIRVFKAKIKKMYGS